MFKVVNGMQLRGKVTDSEKPYFYGTSGRKTKEEYKQLLVDSQDYFQGIMNGTISIEDEYFIYAPQSYLDNGTATGVSVITNDITGVNAKLLYLKNPIKVTKKDDGYFFASSDGRHRYVVAQKYDLDLLVDEVEEISSQSEQIYVKTSILSRIKELFSKKK